MRFELSRFSNRQATSQEVREAMMNMKRDMRCTMKAGTAQVQKAEAWEVVCGPSSQ